MQIQKHSVAAFLILALGAALIGIAPIFVRLSELSPSWVLFYRMFLALPFLMVLNFYLDSKNPFRLKERKTYLIAAIAGLAFCVDMTGWHWSLEFTSISNATIMVNTAPIYVALFGFFVLREAITVKLILAMLITYLGVFGLIVGSPDQTPSSVFGDVISLIAAFFYAAYLILISQLGYESPTKVILYTTFFCGLFSLPAAFTESSLYVPTEINGWLNLIALAVLCQVGGQYFITIGMPKVKASFAAIGLLMQPITATILGALIMMEWLTIFQSMFGVLALTGIYLARLELTNGSKN